MPPLILLLTLSILQLLVASTRDVKLSITSDSLNSASRVYYNQNALQHIGSLNDITTSDLKDVLPAAFKACPKCPIKFAAAATSPPSISITEKNGGEVTANAAVSITATRTKRNTTEEEDEVSLFVLSVNGIGGVTFTNKPSDSGDFIKMTLAIGSLDVHVNSSSVGPVPTVAVAVLAPMVKAFLKLAVSAFNVLFPGFPLPSLSSFNVSNLLIATADQQISVELDITPVDGHPRRLLIPPWNKHARRSLPPHFSSPGFQANVGNVAVDKVLHSLLPKIITQVNGMILPALSGVAKGITYETAPIHIDHFNIGSSDITLVENHGVLLSLRNMSLVIPSTAFNLSKKIIIVTARCHGTMSGNLSDEKTSVQLLLNVSALSTGAPQILSNTTWNWGEVNVEETMDGTVCHWIQDLASWFVGNINHFIAKEIQKYLPETMDSMIRDEGNQILSELMLTKNIDTYASVNFYLTNSPITFAKELDINLSGEFVPASIAEEEEEEEEEKVASEKLVQNTSKGGVLHAEMYSSRMFCMSQQKNKMVQDQAMYNSCANALPGCQGGRPGLCRNVWSCNKTNLMITTYMTEDCSEKNPVLMSYKLTETPYAPNKCNHALRNTSVRYACLFS